MTDSSRDTQILRKIIGYCADIEFTHNEYARSYDVFCANPTYRNAIALCLLQIGELVNNLSDDFKDRYDSIPWRAIKGMRNIVAHHYGKIDTETVWETSEAGIRELRSFCEERIAEQPL